MNRFTHQLPLLAGGVYLTATGVGMDRWCTAERWHITLKSAAFPNTEARFEKLNSYYREIVELAFETGTGFIQLHLIAIMLCAIRRHNNFEN